MEQAGEVVEEARRELESAAQTASDAMGGAALWTFVGLLVGAFVAVLGSLAGKPATLADTHASRVR